MKVTTREPSLESLDALSGLEALCVFIREDERPLRGTAGFADWRMCGKLSRVLLEGFFQGQRAENLLLPTEGQLATPRLFAFGAGTAAELNGDRLAELLTHAGQTLKRAGVRAAAVELPGGGVLGDEERARVWSRAFAPAFEGDSLVILAEKALGKLLSEPR